MMEAESTALITGGTSGLGAAFAHRLAAEGRNVVLVARDPERLDSFAEELRAKHGVEVETIAADLSTEEGRSEVEARLIDDDKPVDFLVNNAGYGMKGKFVEVTADEHEKMLNVNALAVLRLMHAALAVMTERGRGDVINVSSVAGFLPGLRPSSTYAATKAFVTALTEGLAPSLEKTGVHLSAVCPGWVRSEFHKRAGIDMSRLPKWLWLQPDDVAETALKDHRAGRTLSIPGVQYKTITAGARIAPRSLINRASHVFKHRAN